MTNAVSRLLALSFGLSTLLGCGSSPSPDVEIRFDDHYGYALGRSTRIPRLSVPYSARILVGPDGASVIEGEFSDGRFVFPDTPSGENVLETTTPASSLFPTDLPHVAQRPQRARSIQYGGRNWARGDIELTDEPMHVLLDAVGLDWKDGDDITFVSRTADVLRTLDDDFSDPAEGATMAQWDLDLQTLAASYGEGTIPLLVPEDDLVVITTRTVDAYPVSLALPRWDPYYLSGASRVVQRAEVTGRWLEIGDTSLFAEFTAAPTTTQPFDFRGSTFAAIRTELGIPDASYADVRFDLTHEAGTSANYFYGVSPRLWSFSSGYTNGIPVNAACYPDRNDECDPVACAGGCDSNTTGIVDPGDIAFPLVVPHPFTTPGTEVLSVLYRFRRRFTNPTTGGSINMVMDASMFVPLSSTDGRPITLALGPPRDLRVAGMAIPWAASAAGDSTFAEGVGATPTITFAAPSIGTPDHYRVDIRELEVVTSTANVKRYGRTVATVITRGTSATVPSGVLVDGRFYYVSVTAVSNGNDLEDLMDYPRNVDDVSTSSATGAFRL